MVGADAAGPVRARRWAAVSVGVVGALDLLLLIVPPWHPRASAAVDWLPFDLAGAGTVATAASGLLLLYLADGLARGKRRAWWVAVLVLVAAEVLRLVAGRGPVAQLLSLAALGLLVSTRGAFTASADPITRRRGALVAGGAVAAGASLGLLVVQLRAGTGARSLPFGERLGDVLLGLGGIPTPLDQHETLVDDFVYFSLLGLGLSVATIALAAVLAPARPVRPQTRAEGGQVRSLLRVHGKGDSLGYFALHEDKSLLFSADGRAAVAYRVVSGVMLASGDPVGDPAAWDDVIARFVRTARQRAWVPAVVGASAEGARVWARSGGLESFDIGDEAVVQTASFGLDGRAMRNVRQMVSRARRRGWTAQVRRLGALDPAERERLVAAVAEMRQGRVERGYSMALGRFGGADDDDLVVATAHRGDELGGVLVLVPWGDRRLSLDLMRRRGRDDAGVVELLVAEVLQLGPGLGIDAVSLNFAAFRSAFTPPAGSGATRAAWARTVRVADRVVPLEPLERFSAKFGPAWHTRYLMFPGVRDLPRVSVAALEAERFLVRPTWWPTPARLAGRRRDEVSA